MLAEEAPPKPPPGAAYSPQLATTARSPRLAQRSPQDSTNRCTGVLPSVLANVASVIEQPLATRKGSNLALVVFLALNNRTGFISMNHGVVKQARGTFQTDYSASAPSNNHREAHPSLEAYAIVTHMQRVAPPQAAARDSTDIQPLYFRAPKAILGSRHNADTGIDHPQITSIYIKHNGAMQTLTSDQTVAHAGPCNGCPTMLGPTKSDSVHSRADRKRSRPQRQYPVAARPSRRITSHRKDRDRPQRQASAPHVRLHTGGRLLHQPRKETRAISLLHRDTGSDGQVAIGEIRRRDLRASTENATSLSCHTKAWEP